MKKQLINEQFRRMQKIAGLITENESNESSDLEVKWAPEYYKNTKEYGGDAYHEMGLVDAPYAMVGDKKVKEIVGYFYDEDEEEDEEIIGYIFSKSGKDIESYSEDELDDAFMKAVDIENNRLSESNTTKNQINEESHSPDKIFELIQMYISNYRDGGMGAGAALKKIEDILDGKLDGYDIAFLKGEEDLYESESQLDAYAFLEKKGYQIDNTEDIEMNGVKYEKIWYTDDNGLYQYILDKIEEDLYENKTQLNEDKETEAQAEKIKALIYQNYREIVDSGQVEKGTEEWLFLLQLALKVYGLDIKNEYDILKGIDGKGPYAKQIKALDYSKPKKDWLRALEIALSDLEVDAY
jgi:hypothetical protein